MAEQPVIAADLEAAVEDLRLAARHPRYVAQMRIGSMLTDPREHLCRPKTGRKG